MAVLITWQAQDGTPRHRVVPAGEPDLDAIKAELSDGSWAPSLAAYSVGGAVQPWQGHDPSYDPEQGLLAALAVEARIITTALDYKTFPKTVREHAEDVVRRLRAYAVGDFTPVREHTTRALQSERRILTDKEHTPA